VNKFVAKQVRLPAVKNNKVVMFRLFNVLNKIGLNTINITSIAVPASHRVA
jgi:hypothetical protein